MHFQLQLDAAAIENCTSDSCEQRGDVACRRSPNVVNKVCVQRRDFRAALPPSLSAHGFDESRGLSTVGVAKARSGIGKRNRLSRFTPHEARLHLAANLARVRARKSKRYLRDHDVALQRRMAIQ